jgi:hypothetical protein
MTETTTATTEKMLERIAALLAKADGTDNAHEADAFRAKADELMAKYRIADEEVRQSRLASGTAAQPIVRLFPAWRAGSPYSDKYWEMLYWVCDHIGVRVTGKGTTRGDDDTLMRQVVLVGFDSDVEYAQRLYLSVALHFSATLEPKYNPALSDEENVYRLRNAGIERGRIGEIMGWGGEGTKGPGRVTATYKKGCQAKGEDPRVIGRSINAKTYRSSFATAYSERIWTRLYEMRLASGLESGAIVLRGRREAVDEAFYELRPDLRPSTEVAQRRPCRKCERSKSGFCRDHKPRAAKDAPYSAVGAQAGDSAARTADLGPSATTRKLGSA